MSPSVITSVAAEPMFRIDETGLPISMSRVRTVALIGARIVALASCSSLRSTAAWACATLAVASDSFAWLMPSCTCAPAFRFCAISSALFASSSDCGRDELLRGQLLRTIVVAAGELDIGRLGGDPVLLELGPGGLFGGLRRPAGSQTTHEPGRAGFPCRARRARRRA
jgi:hypothetical protein